jgi:exopolysaccharide biosynthesis polyprenyl glycosylphosphotransferase
LFFAFEGFKFGYLRLSNVIVTQCVALFIANFITYLQLCLIANVMISPVPILILMVLDAGVALFCCYVYSVIYHHLYVPKRMLMIFGSEDALFLKFKMDMRSDKYRIVELIHEKAGCAHIIDQIPNYDAVILNDVSAQLRNDVLKYCYQNQVRTYVAPKISDIVIRGAESINLFDTPLLLVKGRGLTPVQKFWKRLMDIVICSLAMLVAAPIMLITAAAIKLEDGGPVFFMQKRATLDGKAFDIIKFRSMIVDAEKEGISIPATGRDPRITKVGRVIRATRIDELPQILNILKGDMSVVGPRPERLEHVQKYSENIPEFAYRLKVKGGLTGYAQIYGKYNTSAYDKLRLDLMYIENYSLMLDIRLILMTIRIMLKKDSTEGFEKAEELERMKQEALRSIPSSETEEFAEIK